MNITINPATDITWQDWLMTAISGALGSVIALGGVFAVYLLTQRAERSRATEIRRSESVVDAIRASAVVSRPLSKPDPEISRSRSDELDALSHAMILFAAREMREHPLVGEWAIKISDATSRIATELHNESDADVRQAITEKSSTLAVRIATSLIFWLRHPDFESFVDPDSASQSE